MNALIGALADRLITMTVTLIICYYPLKGRLRVSLTVFALLHIFMFALQSAALIAIQNFYEVDYVGYQYIKLFTGFITIILPFFLIRGSFFKSLFLLTVLANYMTVIFGVGHYVEITFGGRFAEKYPYLIYIGVTVILSVLLLPILIRVVVNIFDILPSGKTLIWKFIWIIPTVFFVLCMTTGNILMGTGAVTSIFVTVRVIMGAGMVVTCYLFARALRYEMRNAELIENARMMQNQLKLQHEQYAGLMKNVETEKNARHDLRHQLAVLKGYGADGDLDKLNGYLEKLVGNLPVSKAVYCENYAVNAVVNHHLSALNSEDIKLDIKLDIPEDTGNVSAMDLCVMIGNFFENAVHACRRVKVGEKFIRVRSRVDGKTLSVTVENSFGGLWHYDDKNGVYLSMKENSAENIPREGVGLSSVKAVCEKYNGSMRIEIENKVWKAAGLVYMK